MIFHVSLIIGILIPGFVFAGYDLDKENLQEGRDLTVIGPFWGGKMGVKIPILRALL